MRHHYKGPRPITKQRYKGWLTEGLQSGKVGQVHNSGIARFKTGEPPPWVEDEKPEPEGPTGVAGARPHDQLTDGRPGSALDERPGGGVSPGVSPEMSLAWPMYQKERCPALEPARQSSPQKN